MAKRRKSKKRAQRKFLKFCIGLLTAVLVCCVGYLFKDEFARPDREVAPGGELESMPDLTDESYLTVHYIDVGQGDSILVTCGGEYLLIDAGENGNGDTVVGYLNDLGIERLDLVIATHTHSDHIGSMDEVLEAIPADEVWFPEYRSGLGTEKNFLNAVDDCGATLRQPALGESYTLGGATVTVLGPVKCDYSEGSDNHYSDPNDMSIIVMVQFGENKFLFTGDMENTDKAENDLVAYWREADPDALKADVLKVGHHGSKTSTSYSFLRAVDPRYAIISVGEGNRFGHPKAETLEILGDAEVYTYRTDYMGTIVAVSDGSEILFGWENADAEPYIPE